jgi:multicomponent Na+:H+ antiporter subunit G
VTDGTDWIVALLMLGGSAFMLLSAIGLLRMPDLLTRMQASTKASTLGAACLLGAFAIRSGEVADVSRAILVVVFLFVTTPVAAHMIARAAHRRLEERER